MPTPLTHQCLLFAVGWVTHLLPDVIHFFNNTKAIQTTLLVFTHFQTETEAGGSYFIECLERDISLSTVKPDVNPGSVLKLFLKLCTRHSQIDKQQHEHCTRCPGAIYNEVIGVCARSNRASLV